MPDQKELRKAIEDLKTALAVEKAEIEYVSALVKRQIERDVGIWEYDFDELEQEMWTRFATLEDISDCLLEGRHMPRHKLPAALMRRLKNLYRTLTAPLSRSVIGKQVQFDLEQQNLVNKENIPFHLSVILTLQKIKNRLNALEESTQKLKEDQHELFMELQRQANREGSGKEE